MLEETLQISKEHLKLMEAIDKSVDQITLEGLVKLVVRHRLYLWTPELKDLVEQDRLNKIQLRETIRKTARDQIDITISQIQMLEEIKGEK